MQSSEFNVKWLSGPVGLTPGWQVVNFQERLFQEVIWILNLHMYSPHNAEKLFAPKIAVWRIGMLLVLCEVKNNYSTFALVSACIMYCRPVGPMGIYDSLWM